MKLSKRLSYVLRHDPASLGLELDRSGWAGLDDLLGALRSTGVDVELERLLRLDGRGSKQRFEIDTAGGRIRARYGHSVPVAPDHEVVEPPAVLHHGTHAGAVERILVEGLRRMGRQQVHLSTDVATAREVGARRGRPVVLTVDAAGMHADGHVFRRATRTTWLVDAVPPDYLGAPDRPHGRGRDG